MGLRSSKESKLAQRFSSKRRYKRQNPEGQSSHTSSIHNKKLNSHRCQCTVDQQYNDSVKINYEAHQPRLAQSLRVAVAEEKTPGSKSESSFATSTPLSKWTLTFETSNKKLSDLMTSLQPHVESVKLDEADGENQNIRIRFRDSPNLNKTGQFAVELHSSLQTDLPRSSEDPRTNSVGCFSQNRNEHYEQIPGSSHPLAECPEEARRRRRHKQSSSRSRSRDCCRRHSGCCTRGSASRFQSPFDHRSFQEAMLLRLTELKRGTSLHPSCARGMESNDSEEQLKDGSDSEYSGDEDNRVNSSANHPDCLRLFQPLSALELQERRRKNSNDSSCPSQRRTRAATSVTTDKSVLKPWDKPTTSRPTGKKKNLTKKRSHGYLRASAVIEKGEAIFPNTPKSSTKQSMGLQRYEHIHHHYFHNFNSDT